PACADGTAILWESMSPPFFKESSSEMMGIFCYRCTVSPFGLDSPHFFIKWFMNLFIIYNLSI
ncbi:hypothetical protein, partial [Flavobacterium sp. GCM10027622]|uniref:hypothetical protein n=1 Tax=unclassified Flavobacterium TaxID=196869 RepID=UPI003614FE43